MVPSPELNQASHKIIHGGRSVGTGCLRSTRCRSIPRSASPSPQVLRSTLRQDPDIPLVGRCETTRRWRLALRGAITRPSGADHLAHQRRRHQCPAPHRHGAPAIWWRRPRPWWPSGWCGEVCEHCACETAPDEGSHLAARSPARCRSARLSQGRAAARAATSPAMRAGSGVYELLGWINPRWMPCVTTMPRASPRRRASTSTTGRWP